METLDAVSDIIAYRLLNNADMPIDSKMKVSLPCRMLSKLGYSEVGIDLLKALLDKGHIKGPLDKRELFKKDLLYTLGGF